MGILGDKFIEINAGSSSSSTINPNDTIAGLIAIGFEDILTSATSIMHQLDTSITKLNLFITAISDTTGSFGKLISDPDFYNNLTHSVKTLTIFINQIASSKGTFSKLLRDTSLFTNINNASIQLSTLINHIDKGINNNGLAGNLINDEILAADIHQTILSLKHAANSINELLIDIKRDPKKYFNIKLF
jgi:ABC-type transporter Mla subunit MlaD